MRIWTPPDGFGSQAEQSVPLASRGKVDVYILAESILKSTRGAPAKWITVDRSRKYDTKQQLLTAIFQELNELETAASRQWQHENAGFDRSRRRDINHTGNMEPTLKGAKSTAHQPSHMNTNAHIVEKNEGTFAPVDDSRPARRLSQEILLLVDDFSLAERLSTLIFLDASSCSPYIWRRRCSHETRAHHLRTFMKMWRWHFWWIQMMFKLMPLKLCHNQTHS